MLDSCLPLPAGQHQLLHPVPMLDSCLPLPAGQHQLPPPILRLPEGVRGPIPTVELSSQVKTGGCRSPLHPANAPIRIHLRTKCLVAKSKVLQSTFLILHVTQQIMEVLKSSLDLPLVWPQVRVTL